MITVIDKTDVRIRKHLMRFIPERLAELGMSEADLARMTGDSTAQINRAARGVNTPSLAFGMRLADALKCSLDELCGHAVHANS